MKLVTVDKANPSSQPTNHLDIEGLDALMAALSSWNGGVIVISHDERFITTVAKEVCCSISSMSTDC